MYSKLSVTSSLNASLDAKIQRHFDSLDTDPDVLEQLLADKRSQNTKDAYIKDLRDFFLQMTGKEPTQDAILEFLHLEEKQAIAVTLKYKSRLMKRGLAEATVNRRLAAIKSLVVMGKKLGVCAYSLTESVKGEKTRQYRDTSGIDTEEFSRVLQQCDLSTLRGLRDYAILRLLWGNALRRNEVCQLKVADFSADEMTLSILGKGQGTQKEVVDLGTATVQAISTWLSRCPLPKYPDSPLFIALDYANYGHGLTGDFISKTVSRLCKQAGIKKQMSAHRIRHSSITAALNSTQGNVREVQKLSRHSKIETLMIYDDNRLEVQKKITNLLDDLV